VNRAAVASFQEEQYSFPYHWLPEVVPGGGFSVGRCLRWGLEYITCMDAVARHARRLAPRSLLDVGCGDGRLADFLKGSEIRYRGIDLSEAAITLARSLNARGDYRAADLADLEESHDAVALVEVLEHIPDPEIPSFMVSINRLTRSGGALLVSVPTSNRPVNRKHFRHYDLAMLGSQLGQGGFEIEYVAPIFRIGPLSTLFERLCSNRFFTLNPSILTKAIWRLHRAFTYRAGERDGAHLFVQARKARDMDAARVLKAGEA
jgi:SAM-dependent methyltransferase